jgi:hypothetical protein
MKTLQILLASLILSILAACGGGGGDGAVQGSTSGTAIKGPVSNATVTAYAISNGQMGTQIATTTTNSSGSFTMNTGSYDGPMMLQVNNGSYTDEATGSTMTMIPGDVMTAVIPSVAAGATISGIQVTPITAMAQRRAEQMSGHMTDANIAAANTAMGNYFSVNDILHTQPMNPLANNSGTTAGVTQDMKNYGMVLAAMSQSAKTLNMNTSTLVTGMMSDATDGVMNGMMTGGSPIQMPMGGGMMGSMPSTAGTSSLGAAMTSFISSGANASGLTTPDMAALITKLNISNGQI